MRSSEALFGGIVLLFFCGSCSAYTRTRPGPSGSESLVQTQTQRETPSLHPPFNRTQRAEPVPYHLSHKLRVYQLRKPQQQQGVDLQASADQWGSESGQQGHEETVLAEELLVLLIPGPDLNPPLESEMPVKSEVWLPIPAQSVAVYCGEETASVEVKQDFLGNSQLVNPADLTLGGCAAHFVNDGVLHFRTDLQGCNSTMAMTEEALIYSFSLRYDPKAVGSTAILKTNAAEMVVECQYPRRQYASSGAVRPTWSQFAAGMWAEQQLHFSLRLMTEDWQSPRPSSTYFLSEVIQVEAAVLGGSHIPLRVFVDSCVATVSMHPESTPRYPFITNHGCLSDSMVTGSKSYFMPRSHEDKLHFQLKAFKFHQDDRNLLYITCHLKATALSAPVDSQHKACSFLTDRWVASGGDNLVCGCCETSCDQQGRHRRHAASSPQQVALEGTASLGPITLEGSVMEGSVLEVAPPSKPATLSQTQESSRAASYWSTALLCGAGVALAALVLASVAFCRKTQKSVSYDVPT
ncbi:zona pellucida sperm-binding protein 3-like [Nelusetta ayraudi]|uniref:zona pellucida sperm-binding protein 3-like n=1 Tax=Nelusetta ayraudi TaxID=303726 RepID=UPI003F71F414